MTALNKERPWTKLIDPKVDGALEAIRAEDNLGRRPALLCIDNCNAVFGGSRQPLEEMVKRFPFGCGTAAWDALDPTKQILTHFRRRKLPVVHSALDSLPTPDRFRVSGIKGATKTRLTPTDRAWFKGLEPLDEELRIYKRFASAFFATPLATHLRMAEVDTLLVCGNTTSGCIRATVVDAFSLGFKVGVIEECVFDRNELSHMVNLYDMNFKYANVMQLTSALDYIAALE